jgi:hypothetical protein
MSDQQPILDLTDHHACIANARGAITPGQNAAIMQFLSTALQSTIVGALAAERRTWGFRYPYQVKHALDRGQVVSVDGLISPSGRFHPAGATPAPALRFPTWSGQPGDLLPGHYRFYYLPDVAFVLSAQSLSPEGKALVPVVTEPVASPPDPTLQPLAFTLARASGFNQSDLSENRTGRLSAQQQRALLANTGAQRAQRLVLGGACTLTGLLAVWASQSGQITSGSPIVLSLFGLLFATVGLLVLWKSDAYGVAVRAGRVVAIEGIGMRLRVARTYPVRYAIHIGVERFFVSKEAYEAFVEHRPYRAYYLPGLSYLVNIEPLSHASAVTYEARPDLRAAS